MSARRDGSDLIVRDDGARAERGLTLFLGAAAVFAAVYVWGERWTVPTWALLLFGLGGPVVAGFAVRRAFLAMPVTVTRFAPEVRLVLFSARRLASREEWEAPYGDVVAVEIETTGSLDDTVHAVVLVLADGARHGIDRTSLREAAEAVARDVATELGLPAP